MSTKKKRRKNPKTAKRQAPRERDYDIAKDPDMVRKGNLWVHTGEGDTHDAVDVIEEVRRERTP